MKKIILSAVLAGTVLSTGAFAAMTDAEIASQITGDNTMVINNITCDSGSAGYMITIVNPEIKTQELKFNSCTSSKIEMGQPVREDVVFLYRPEGDSVIISTFGTAKEFKIDKDFLEKIQSNGDLKEDSYYVPIENKITSDETGTRFYYEGELIEGEGMNYFSAPEGHDYPSSVVSSSDYSTLTVTSSTGEVYTLDYNKYIDSIIVDYGADMGNQVDSRFSFLNGELFANGVKVETN